MSEFEFVQRARMCFANRTQDFSYDWIDEAKACYDNYLENGEDDEDPEYWVDEEISRWD